MSENHYHPIAIWKTMQLAADNEDYLMVGLSAFMLCLTPIAYPAMCVVELVGKCISGVIASDNHE